MVPAVFVELPELPVTAAGKIDRRALPDPEARAGARKVVAPQTALEREIAGIWREVLQIPEVGVNDNFFDLGGHSLLLMIVLNKLQESRAETLDIVELFEHPTVSLLAQHLRTRPVGPAQAGARPAEKPAAATGGASAEEIKRQRLAAREQRRQARRGSRE
ncbi:phosphopantetheine-binding protein [Chondromyces apiculatus]